MIAIFQRRSLICVVVFFLTTQYFFGFSVRWLLLPLNRSDLSSHSNTLPTAAKIYVVSLPRRQDRRKDMDALRKVLGLQWTYVDAVESTDEIVTSILDRVQLQRSITHNETNPDHSLMQSTANLAFHWPDDIDPLASSDQPLQPSGSDLWISTSAPNGSASSPPLMCATEDDVVLPYVPGSPDYKILTAPKIACWHSHLSVIRRVANNEEKPDVTLVLEDDIDIELDIRQRLASIWRLLPKTWDIVFLGHCWSNESYYPPLPFPPTDSTVDAAGAKGATNPIITRLHPAFAPKCTHAYAISFAGARRLLLHLSYPPFAYSRALDQAFSWLVSSRRLIGFSVVPSVVVQRKVGESDVMEGNGSRWRETLVGGLFRR